MAIMESQVRNLIGTGTTIKGDIESNGDIRIDGRLIGSLKSNGKVVIGSYAEGLQDLIGHTAVLTGQADLNGDAPPPKGKDEGAHFDGLGTGTEAE